MCLILISQSCRFHIAECQFSNTHSGFGSVGIGAFVSFCHASNSARSPRHRIHVDEIAGDANGAKLAFSKFSSRPSNSRRLHRPRRFAFDANSRRSGLVWPTDAPNKGAQRTLLCFMFPTGPTVIRLTAPGVSAFGSIGVVIRPTRSHLGARSCRTRPRLDCKVARGRTSPSWEPSESSSPLSPWVPWGQSRGQLTRRRS
jgi:hypothetical protein